MRTNQQIRDEAAEWFVDFREGDAADVSAQQAFARWLRQSPDHIKAYMEIAALWADVPGFASKEDVDVEGLIAYARAEDNVVSWSGDRERALLQTTKGGPAGLASSGEVPLTATSRVRRRRLRMTLAAASLAAMIVGATLIAQLRAPVYSTDVGEQRSILLSDGSAVDLNAKSRLRVRFSANARDVELVEGQALFRVARDPQRPFVVSSGQTSVRAVGTQFDVYRKKSGTTVTVLEGQVAVRAPQTPVTEPAVMLSAGQQIVVNPQRTARPSAADISSATAWTQRQIVFQATPLGEVVEEFNRYNPRQMALVDATLEPVRISGVFSSTDPAALLRFLREQVQLTVVEDPKSIRISRQ